MSAGRRHRRAIARNTTPPANITAAARQASCPDCDSDVSLDIDSNGIWRTTIAHDAGCPQLAWRERNNAMTQVALVAEPGHAIPGEAVTELAQALAAEPGVRALRISTTPALSWQEREALDLGADDT